MLVLAGLQLVVSPEGHDQLAPEDGPIHETARLVHVVQKAQGGGWHWQHVEAQWVEQLQAKCWQQVKWLEAAQAA